MRYVKEFQKRLENQNFPELIHIWEEYWGNETVDSEELKQILQHILSSNLAGEFGAYAETALPLWEMIEDEKASYEIIRLLLDLQTTNSPTLANVAYQLLEKKYGSHPNFIHWIRLVGLRTKEHFQKAISNCDLLAHMEKGKFVFHTGGWGVGEIVEISLLREQLAVEFENIGRRKEFSFSNAFNTLAPLSDDHFLARRFGDPDLLEKEAKENPVAVIQLLLRDVGPKTAAEIKDELCELVIPEKEWSKWWQGTRTKIKKDTFIESPKSLRDPFRLRQKELSHEERFQKAIQNKTGINEAIHTIHIFVRDFPDILKKPETKEFLKEKLLSLLSSPNLTPVQELQIRFFLENQLAHHTPESNVQDLIQKLDNVEDAINAIEIVALKKRVLAAVRKNRKDWIQIFLSLLFTLEQPALKDYLLKELHQEATAKPLLEEKLKELLHKPAAYPEAFVWYFQKIANKEDLPFNDKESLCHFFENFLILFHVLEPKPQYRDLLKKMYSLLSGKRYALVRSIIQETSLEFIKEFLLLISKCQSLGDHDLKILRSLAEVVHPSLSARKQGLAKTDNHIIWTTEEGYFKTQERIRQIGTVEIVENAREIEAARALGDLRENSEYKFALEKRSQLQAELKMLSEQLNRARIITKEDISPKEVGIGAVVDLIDSQGKKISYTILGPWDADPENHIISLQSKLAQAMVGCAPGDAFQFRGEEFKVTHVKSYLNQ